jgi:hypothetical protein
VVAVVASHATDLVFRAVVELADGDATDVRRLVETTGLEQDEIVVSIEACAETDS